MDKEIKAMTDVASALDALGGDATTIDRVLRWVISKYGSGDVVRHDPAKGRANSGAGVADEPDGSEFEDLADIFHLGQPRTDPQRALLAGFWLTVGESKVEFTGFDVNKRLKDLGYGASNITDALGSLIGRRPSLVMQTAKSGTSKQARKRYKLTRAGIDEAQAMITTPNGAS